MNRTMCFFMTLVVFLFPLLSEEGKATKQKDVLSSYDNQSLVVAAFKALKTGKISVVEPFVMAESHYRILSKDLIKARGEEFANKMVADATKRAQVSLQKSFTEILDILKKLNFDWKQAEVVQVFVFGNDGRVEYQNTNTKPRLDIHYIIKSGENYLRIKLDDTFLIEGKRYLGNGYRLNSCKLSDVTPELKKMIMEDRVLRRVVTISESKKESSPAKAAKTKEVSTEKKPPAKTEAEEVSTEVEEKVSTEKSSAKTSDTEVSTEAEEVSTEAEEVSTEAEESAEKN